MNQVNEICAFFGAGGLSLTLMAVFVAAPLALLVLLVDRVAGGWMTSRVRCWLWVLVALRLLLPISLVSPISAVHIWHLVGWTEQAPIVGQTPTSVPDFLAKEHTTKIEPVRNSMAEVLIEGRENILPDLAGLVDVAQEWEQLWWADEASELEPYATSGLTLAAQEWDWEELLGMSLVGFWFVGIAVVLLRAVVASLRFAWQLRSIPEVDHQSTIDTVLRVCDQVGVRRPKIKLVPGLPTPALFGVFRPTLCLPEDSRETLSNNQLRMIALHEAMHIRRGDGYLSWLLTLVRAIHWFNPVAWFTIKQIETYRELACDEAVRQFTEPQEREGYAELLLRFAAGRPAASLGLLGLWFARPAKNLSARIDAITANNESKSRMPWQMSFALVALLAVVGLTDAASTRAVESIKLPELPTFSISETSAWEVLQARARGEVVLPNPEEIETREYDLTEALDKVDDVPPNFSAKDWLLLWTKLEGASRSNIDAIEGKPNVVSITMPRQRHELFEAMLAEVCRVGHVGQVVITTRVMSSQQVEKLIDTDWLGTIKYAAPEPVSSSQWAKSITQEESPDFSISMESISFEYAPYTAFVVDEQQMGKLVRYFQSNNRTSITNAPKVTLFSGQSALISDESLTPFVYGVESIKGEYATALQPNIAVLPEGLKLDLQALTLGDKTVDLRCRLTLSSIDGVTNARLPGEEVTVQTPKATRRTVNVRCQLKRGETLLVAPVAGQRSDGQKTYYYAISAEQIFQQDLEESN